jgi:siroheme synthase
VIVTGHERDPERGITWERLRGDTVVVLMATGRLGDMTARMVAAGWPVNTPAAVIMAATTSRQRQVSGSLADIAELTAVAGFAPPTLLVVGEVVSLARELAPALLAATEAAS